MTEEQAKERLHSARWDKLAKVLGRWILDPNDVKDVCEAIEGVIRAEKWYPENFSDHVGVIDTPDFKAVLDRKSLGAHYEW